MGVKDCTGEVFQDRRQNLAAVLRQCLFCGVAAQHKEVSFGVLSSSLHPVLLYFWV